MLFTINNKNTYYLVTTMISGSGSFYVSAGPLQPGQDLQKYNDSCNRKYKIENNIFRVESKDDVSDVPIENNIARLNINGNEILLETNSNGFEYILYVNGEWIRSSKKNPEQVDIFAKEKIDKPYHVIQMAFKNDPSVLKKMEKGQYATLQEERQLVLYPELLDKVLDSKKHSFLKRVIENIIDHSKKFGTISCDIPLSGFVRFMHYIQGDVTKDIDDNLIAQIVCFSDKFDCNDVLEKIIKLGATDMDSAVLSFSKIDDMATYEFGKVICSKNKNFSMVNGKMYFQPYLGSLKIVGSNNVVSLEFSE
jgi:hypothetical protein